VEVPAPVWGESGCIIGPVEFKGAISTRFCVGGCLNLVLGVAKSVLIVSYGADTVLLWRCALEPLGGTSRSLYLNRLSVMCLDGSNDACRASERMDRVPR